jgi:hypothetical protein
MRTYGSLFIVVGMLVLAMTSAQAQNESTARIGEVIIVGNTKTPDAEIRKQLDFYPGEILRYPSLRLAEEKLTKLGNFVVDARKGIRPTVSVLDNDGPFKDILVKVQEAGSPKNEAARQVSLLALMKSMDGFRKKLPPPQGLGEMNGVGTPDIDGEVHPGSHLWGIATRMEVKTRAECLILLTYLKDRQLKIRHIAAFALENVVKAYPNGFPAGAHDELDSDQHRRMVLAFVAGIEKLTD